ncbi:hypothetical protein FACS1894105_08250 [Clostridia bacterium]|nr:hypothetical protein FACS1894105_08250 [Clostridia bacterium]GHV13027.1 hypothetical protein FACS1894219_07100 [Clostridia bacterium]
MTEKNSCALHIYTLGRFEIYSNGAALANETRRSVRMWNLFKYILANRHKMCSVGELIEILWDDDYCDNPEKALHNLIYRLRHSISPNGDSDDLILYTHGCYKWNEEFPVWLDCDALEDYGKRGKELVKTSLHGARLCYEKLIELYNGDFLSDIIFDIWVLPIRTTYKRLYLDAVNTLIKLLDQSGDYEAIITVCNNIFKVDYLDEDINLRFLKALIALNRKDEAKEHYSRISNLMYRELGIKPSYELTELLGNTTGKVESNSKNITLSSINETLWLDEKLSGAFVCNNDAFLSVSKVMLRNLERSGLSIMMVLATFSESSENKDYQPNPDLFEKDTDETPSANEISVNMVIENAKSHFASTFRSGDIICRWNSRQIIMLLTNLTFEDAESVMTRIAGNEKDALDHEGLSMSFHIIPLDHEVI